MPDEDASYMAAWTRSPNSVTWKCAVHGRAESARRRLGRLRSVELPTADDTPLLVSAVIWHAERFWVAGRCVPRLDSVMPHTAA